MITYLNRCLRLTPTKIVFLYVDEKRVFLNTSIVRGSYVLLTHDICHRIWHFVRLDTVRWNFHFHNRDKRFLSDNAPIKTFVTIVFCYCDFLSNCWDRSSLQAHWRRQWILTGKMHSCNFLHVFLLILLFFSLHLGLTKTIPLQNQKCLFLEKKGMKFGSFFGCSSIASLLCPISSECFFLIYCI